MAIRFFDPASGKTVPPPDNFEEEYQGGLFEKPPAAIYVVMGTTGEYSDRDEWPVMGYFSEGKAQEHVIRASTRARVFTISHTRFQYPEDDEWIAAARAWMGNLDPGIQIHPYTGEVMYFYHTVPIGA